MLLVSKQTCCFKVQVCLDMCEKKRLPQNITYNCLIIVKRTTLQQIQNYKISKWLHIEVLNDFISGGVHLCIKVYTETFLHLGNYKKF